MLNSTPRVMYNTTGIRFIPIPPTAKAPTMTHYASESDRLAELKRFDDSKLGVKGLVDSGAATIPDFFHHPPEILSSLRSTSSADIPTIDLLAPGAASRAAAAARDFGFFQLLNHGVPADASDALIRAFAAFNSQPAAERAAHYSRGLVGTGGVNFNTNVDLFQSRAASWRDTLQVRTAPELPDWSRVPEVCRAEVAEWDRRVVALGEVVMGMLCEGLGVVRERLKELSCLESRALVAHYYPYCPEPDRTLGLGSHTDPGVVTVLLQSQVGGLQVKHGEEWVEVKPLEGALVINVGDLLQIMSNDEYKSVEHRVVANALHEPRISVAVFFNPSKRGDTDYFGPLRELITHDKPALYQNFTVSEYMKKFFSKELGALINSFKLPKT